MAEATHSNIKMILKWYFKVEKLHIVAFRESFHKAGAAGIVIGSHHYTSSEQNQHFPSNTNKKIIMDTNLLSLSQGWMRWF